MKPQFTRPPRISLSHTALLLRILLDQHHDRLEDVEQAGCMYTDSHDTANVMSYPTSCLKSALGVGRRYVGLPVQVA